jgi:hypothetical protein
MRRLILLLVFFVPVACASTASRDDDAAALAASVAAGVEQEAPSSGGFLGGLRDVIADDLRNSGEGLSFFWRSMSRHTARDWAHLTSAFR